MCKFQDKHCECFLQNQCVLNSSVSKLLHLKHDLSRHPSEYVPPTISLLLQSSQIFNLFSLSVVGKYHIRWYGALFHQRLCGLYHGFLQNQHSKNSSSFCQQIIYFLYTYISFLKVSQDYKPVAESHSKNNQTSYFWQTL